MIFKSEEPNIKKIATLDKSRRSDMRFSLDQLPASQRALCAEYSRWAFVNPSFGTQQRNVLLYAILLGFKPKETLTDEKVRSLRDKGAPHVPTYAVEQALDIETAIIAWSPHRREKIDPLRIAWIEEEIRKLQQSLNPTIVIHTILETLAMVKLIEPLRPGPLTDDDWKIILSELEGESIDWITRIAMYSCIKIIDPARVPEIPDERWQSCVTSIQDHKSGEYVLKVASWLSIISSDGVVSDEHGIRLKIPQNISSIAGKNQPIKKLI